MALQSSLAECYIDNSGRQIAAPRGAAPAGGRMMEGDAIYFRRRASDERAAAKRAEHPAARQAHLEMAGRYDDLASAIAVSEKELGPAG